VEEEQEEEVADEEIRKIREIRIDEVKLDEEPTDADRETKSSADHGTVAEAPREASTDDAPAEPGRPLGPLI
jgi:hypothetical protein